MAKRSRSLYLLLGTLALFSSQTFLQFSKKVAPVPTLSLQLAPHPAKSSPIVSGDDKHPTLPSAYNDHAIPNNLVFTFKYNLLKASPSSLSRGDQVLLTNTLHTIHLHPGATVQFLDDDDCRASIERVMGPSMIAFYNAESDGRFKGDVCRGAALYELGGLYFDLDTEPRVQLWNSIRPNSTFVVPKEYMKRPKSRFLFQAFIGSTPKHPIIWEYLQNFKSYYEGRIEKPQWELGVYFMGLAHQSAPNVDHSRVQLWCEVIFIQVERLIPRERPAGVGHCGNVIVDTPEFDIETSVIIMNSHVNGSRLCE
jgi:hypothetical protein